MSNARYRTVFDGNVEILDATGSAIAPDQAPTARAARGEAFESRLQVKKGRRRLGTFDVRSDALGPSDAGYTLLTVSRVD